MLLIFVSLLLAVPVDNYGYNHTYIVGDSFDIWVKRFYIIPECRKRFYNPVIYMAHGGYQRGNFKHKNEWIVIPAGIQYDGIEYQTVESKAKELHKKFPTRKIVMWVCNERGHSLNVENVYYFKQSVWIVPDGIMPVEPITDRVYSELIKETIPFFGAAGSIYEAVTGETRVPLRYEVLLNQIYSGYVILVRVSPQPLPVASRH